MSILIGTSDHLLSLLRFAKEEENEKYVLQLLLLLIWSLTFIREINLKWHYVAWWFLVVIFIY